MGGYIGVKRRKMLQFLEWLSRKPFLSIKSGGKHQVVVKYSFWDRPFPIPIKHKVVNRFIVAALCKKLVDSNICTKEELEEKLG